MCPLTCGHIQHMYSWWWVGLSPETCRVKAFAKNKPLLLHLVGIIFNTKARCTEPQILSSLTPNRLILQFLFRGEFARNRTISILDSNRQEGIKIKCYVSLNSVVGACNFLNCISREFVYNSTIAGWNKIGELAATRSWYLLQHRRHFIRIVGHYSKLAESRLTG